MSYIESEDNVLEMQLKQLKKSRTGYVSCLTRIANTANELIGDYSNNKQLQILLPKFKEMVHKIYVVIKSKTIVHCYPKKTLLAKIPFFSKCGY